jgi:hypothetical protein
MESLQQNEKITVIYDKNEPFESRIPGYFIKCIQGTPPSVFFYTSALHTNATHTYILLIKSNSIEKGWGTANPARVKRETFIEKQLEKQLEKLN